jgi:hypothetical protein
VQITAEDGDPASVRKIEGSAFAYWGVHSIEVVRDSPSFKTDRPFLLDSKRGLVRYFSAEPKVMINRGIAALRPGCFADCGQLGKLMFDSKSTLTELEDFVFDDCTVAQSIDPPASLVKVHGSAFAKAKIIHISVDAGNRHLLVVRDFLIDASQSRLIRYFGSSSAIILSRSVEVIGSHCLSDWPIP